MEKDAPNPFLSSLAHHAADPFRLLVESVVDYAIYMVDPAGNVASWNPGAERLYGYQAEEIVGQSNSCVYTPEDVAAGKPDEARRRAAADGHYEFEGLRVRSDGSRFSAAATVSSLKDCSGNHVGFSVVTRDITDRNRAREAIDRERDLSSAILSSLPGVFYMYDENRRFLRWNHRFEVVTEYSAAEIEHLQPLDFFAGDDKDRVAERIENVFRNGSDEIEAHFVSKSGKQTPYYFNGVRAEIDGRRCLLGMGIDISAHKRAQEALRTTERQLQQSQKMEAVGRLAGGVAHDFNNLLTVVKGYSECLLDQLPSGDPMREPLQEIHKAADRAADLTRQLLAFSRQQVMEPKVFSLNDVVNDTEKMLRRVLGEDIILTTRLSPNLGLVKADPGQIEQVLINLAVNARDAMPNGGNLTVETQGAILDETYCRGFADLTPGNFVLMAVSDTGCGMDEATKAKIFEPFFTTKEIGKGTGLGLATVHGIVKQSRGHIAVYSEPGHGATFKVYLPEVREPRTENSSDPQMGKMPMGTETVLLVEDEEAVRALAKRILLGCGYQVLEAANGVDAISLAEAHPGTIDLLVSDVVMPHLGGRELAEWIAVPRPNCKVLFLSGYTDDAVIRRGVLGAEFAFLQKPFTPPSLAQKVRSVLDRSR